MALLSCCCSASIFAHVSNICNVGGNGERMTDRIADLRADYDVLGRILAGAEGSAAAAIVRERRIIGELLDALETPEEVPVVDQLAARRTRPDDSGQ